MNEENETTDSLRLVRNTNYPNEIEFNIVSPELCHNYSICVGKEDAKELIEVLTEYFKL